MKTWLRLIALVSLLTLAHSIPATAKECEFDFFYQRLEEVVQVNNPSPQGWWEKTTSVAKGDESKLTDGQKALLATYRASRSKAIQDLQKDAFRSTVKVLLTDTTGFEDEKKYPHVTSDFWAYSSGFMIQMTSKRYGYANGAADAASTFLHEFAHTLDATLSEFNKPYGQDGEHYCNERTGKRAAWLEGFAEFNQMLASADKADDIRNAVKTVMVEDAKKAGEYKYYQTDGKELSASI